MVRRRQTQLTIAQVVLFGLVVPSVEQLMVAWLREVDRALDDDDLVDDVLASLPRRWPQSSRRGRHGTPAETVLRMLALKHLMDWSYDELEREVTGSLVYRRFSRIDAGKVPDAKTMVRLGQLLDGGVLKSLLWRRSSRSAAFRSRRARSFLGERMGRRDRVRRSQSVPVA